MAVDRDGYIFRHGVSPNTLSVISSKNRIFAAQAADGVVRQIGVIATFDPSEARTVEPIRGIGFGDHIAELVPGVTDPMTISVTRTAMYMANIYQVFGYKSGVDGIVRSLKHHRWPFDIRQEIVFSTLADRKLAGSGETDKPKAATPAGNSDQDEDGDAKAVITIYEACWISDYSVSFASDTALVQETVTINCSDVLSAAGFQYDESDSMAVMSQDGAGLSRRLTT